MKSLISHLFVLGCILVGLSSHAWAQNLPLVFGQTETGAISAAAQTNTYTFSANASDVIDFTMITTIGTLAPYIRLYEPNGALLDKAYSNNGYGGCGGPTNIEMNTVIIPAGGTYTLDVSDCSGTMTGNYAIYAQRTNNPSGAANLSYAQTQTGTISSAAQENTYTFSGNLNDEVDFTMLTTSGSLAPSIRLYDPDGTLLTQAYSNNGYGGCGGPTSIEMNTVQLPASGTYTLLVKDCSDTYTGNYAIYAQSTNNPSGSTNLPFGQTQTGSINSSAQENTYTFNANVNDVVDLTMVTTSGNLAPDIRLYEADGSLVSQAYSNNGYGGCGGPTNIEMNTVMIPASGTYTLLVKDCLDVNPGSYAIYAQRTNNPSGAANLPFDQALIGTISSTAQENTYTFNGNLNDEVDFTMVTTSGKLAPTIRLYGPNGTLLSQAYSNNGYGGCGGPTNIEMNTVQLPASGTYNLLVKDCTDTNTGNYTLYAQSTNNPSGPANLPFGQTQTGSISSSAQENTYTFSANFNDVIDFTMVTTNGSLAPTIRLYQPDGTLLSQAYSNNGYGGCGGPTNIEMNTVTIPASGIYTLLVKDCTDTNTGNYALYTQRINNPSGAANLLFAQAQNGSITSTAQSNTYVFSGNLNEVVDFTGWTVSGNLALKFRLYNPNGTLLSEAYSNNGYGGCGGPTNIEMNTVTLPATGTYTLLVGDCTDTNTGNYAIYAQSTNVPFGPAPILWGQVQAGTILSAVQSNTYTFSGSANDVIDLTMATTSGKLAPKMRLYDPNGALLAQTYSNNGYGGCGGPATITLQSISLPGSGAYTLLVGDCTDTNTGTYNLSPQCSGTCPVTPALTWTMPAAITYGTPLSATQLDASANVPGTSVYTPTAGTVLTAGPWTLSVTFTPTNTTEYSTAMDSVQLMVNQATPAITWSTPAPISYGTPLSTTQLDATSPVSGTLAYTPAAGTVLACGVQTLSVSFNPTDTKDYTTNTASVPLTVTCPVPTITSLSPSSALEGAAAQTLTIYGTNFVTSSTITYNNVGHSATSVSPTELQIILSASDQATTGSYPVVVTNPSPGGGKSNSAIFTVLTPAGITVSPTSVSFSSQVINTTSAVKKVTLTSTGTTALNITSIAIAGTNAGDFAQTNNCPASMAVNAKCTINLTFTPSDLGAESANLIVTDNTPNSPQTVPLSGTGEAPVTVTPLLLAFGNVVEGNISAAKVITVTNVQNVALTNIIVTTSSTDYTETNTCGTSIAAGQKCTITVTFAPSIIGADNATLSIFDSASTSPQTVALTGTGTVPVTLTPASATYASQPVGTTSAAKVFTLTSSLNGTLNIYSISASGEFAVSSTTCGTSLASKGKCTIDVVFTPTMTGTLTGTLSVSDSAGNSPQTAALTGTGK